MTYCLNPLCPQPQNPNRATICQACGSPLILRERYQPLRQIGQGGFGQTFLAVDLGLPDRPPCVVKQLLLQAGSGRSAPAGQRPTLTLERCRAEAQRLTELGDHPQIPALLDHFAQPGGYYLVQEWIRGEDLEQQLAQYGPFDEAAVRQVLLEVLPVLQFVHDHQVIHRDIKPANLIRPAGGGAIAVVDFGAAKQATAALLAQTGTTIGSAGYAAPEQVMGKAVFSSDLYSLGVTCIHLLTGLHPFDLYSVAQDGWVWEQALVHPVRPDLAGILNQLLRRSLNQRYRTASAVLQALSSPVGALTARQSGVSPAPAAPADRSRESPPSQPSQPNVPSSWTCRHTLTGHSGAVTAIAIDPRDAVIASGSVDQSIKLWHPKSGDLLHTFAGRSLWLGTGHRDRISALAVTADGSTLISGSDDGTIKLWNLSDRTLRTTLNGEGWIITAIALSPDGEVLVSGGASGAIDLWDLQRGELIERWWRHTDQISGLHLHPRGHALVSSSYDGTVRLWDFRTAQLLDTLRAHRAPVGAIAPLPSWKVLVTAAWDGTLRLWDLEYREPIRTLAAHRDRIRCLAVRPDGALIASGGDDAQLQLWGLSQVDLNRRGAAPAEQVLLYEPDCLRHLDSLPHGWSVNGAAFGANGRSLVSASADETVRIWQSL